MVIHAFLPMSESSYHASGKTSENLSKSNQSLSPYAPLLAKTGASTTPKSLGSPASRTKFLINST